MLPIKNKIILFSCQCFGNFDIFAPQSGFSAVGSALRSGRRGRPFKSGNPDHKKRKFKTEFPFFCFIEVVCYLIRHFPVISFGCSMPMILQSDGATSAKIPLSTFASLFSLM